MEPKEIKELKNRLSYYLRKVKKGERVLTTERERIIATIVSMEWVEEGSRLLSLVNEGFALWKGGKPSGARILLKSYGILFPR